MENIEDSMRHLRKQRCRGGVKWRREKGGSQIRWKDNERGLEIKWNRLSEPNCGNFKPGQKVCIVRSFGTV